MDRFPGAGPAAHAHPGLRPRPGSAPPLPGGLSKVLGVPRGMQEKCHSHCGVSRPALSPPALSRPSSPAGQRGASRGRGAGRWLPQHSSSWYICSSSSWDSRCSRRSVRPLMISSGVFMNLWRGNGGGKTLHFPKAVFTLKSRLKRNLSELGSCGAQLDADLVPSRRRAFP